MSGFMMGMLFVKFITPLARFLKLWIPMAAILPNAVDAVAAINAMAKVFQMAFMSEWCMPPENNELYNLNEKPVQLPNTLASVKEKIIIIKMGE